MHFSAIVQSPMMGPIGSHAHQNLFANVEIAILAKNAVFGGH
jgi:hypothetical protein